MFGNFVPQQQLYMYALRIAQAVTAAITKKKSNIYLVTKHWTARTGSVSDHNNVVKVTECFMFIVKGLLEAQSDWIPERKLDGYMKRLA